MRSALGLLAGVALLNKHTFALLLGALGLALLASPLCSQLRSRCLWLGRGIAALVAAPNLLWNAQNDWPSLAFAAGGTYWDRLASQRRWARRARWVFPALVLGFGIALLPMSLPLFAPSTVARYFEAMGEQDGPIALIGR